MKEEIALAAPMAAHLTFDTAFIGGGTPSTAPTGEIASLMEVLQDHFSIDFDAEITMESNPGTLTENKLAEYRAAGINRLSVGLQSAQDALLQRIGRIHSFADFKDSFRMAREAGFRNINVDVMYGLPGQREKDFLDTLKRLADLAPEHISAYSLILEEGTLLYEDVQRGKETLPDEDAVCDMQEAGQEFLKRAGYLQYEISNYAKPGFECRHNINYWENGEYLGLGLAAHGALRLNGNWTRFENTTDLKRYPSYIEEGMLPTVTKTEIGPEEEMFETVMLGLRMVDGVSLGAFAARFGIPFEKAYPEACRKLSEKGWLELTAQRAKLTKQGLLMQNSALMEFME